ncbi:hypothetical protein AYI68_g7159 [Smittium mucronatum]|uniref:Uncharacterized protein n=1 Tax=Smittium mucronatum TaxID=133383 RepID=A0A1R0GPF5_9FUNG|nr:hypothetical protein AYI68_g7159 [Smittium mucronatum]
MICNPVALGDLQMHRKRPSDSPLLNPPLKKQSRSVCELGSRIRHLSLDPQYSHHFASFPDSPDSPSLWSSTNNTHFLPESHFPTTSDFGSNSDPSDSPPHSSDFCPSDRVPKSRDSSGSAAPTPCDIIPPNPESIFFHHSLLNKPDSNLLYSDVPAPTPNSRSLVLYRKPIFEPPLLPPQNQVPAIPTDVFHQRPFDCTNNSDQEEDFSMDLDP